MLLPFLFVACARKADLAAVEARVAELEAAHASDRERITALEDRLASADPEEPAPPSADAEQAAAELLALVTEAVNGNDFAGAKARLAELLERYPDTRAARAAQRTKAELDVIGVDAPPLAVTKWLEGSETAVAGGEATLYVFFEVWCPHCKREVPKLVDTWGAYHDKGLRIVALTRMSRDVTEDQVHAFVAEHQLPFPVGLEDGSQSKAFAVSGIPAAAIVVDGKIVWRGHPARLTTAVYDSLL